MNGRGMLKAGGAPVHRVRQRLTKLSEDTRLPPDTVPVIDRYADLAAHMHRTAVARRGDRFLVGCICGWFALTAAEISEAAASHRAQGHVLEEADKMFSLLEPKDEEPDGN